MFEGLKKLMKHPSLDLSLPPATTQDLCQLENHEYHYLFDHNNVVHSPCAFNYVFTDQRFYMWQQNHMEGTPHLILRNNIHPALLSRRARIRGKVHTVTAKEILAVDKKVENGVKYERRRVRLIIPINKDVQQNRYDAFSPVYLTAWIYLDNQQYWQDKFQYDANIWRGRRDSAYMPAKAWLDNRPYIGPYFTPTQQPAHQPRMNIAFWRNGYNNLKESIRQEDKFAAEAADRRKLEEKETITEHYHFYGKSVS
jgi:hypothetical protein